MAWVATDKDGTELIFSGKPHRDNYLPIWVYSYYVGRECALIILPFGSITKPLGSELTWEDGPVEIE